MPEPVPGLSGADVARDSTTRLSGAVMTHPRRLPHALALRAGAPAGLLAVAVDPRPAGPPATLRTAIRAWRAVAPDATHHFLLQDDVVPAPGFFAAVARAVAALPDAALAFFTNWSSRNGAAVRMGALTGARWVAATSEYTPCVALALPAAVARGFADFAERLDQSEPDDIAMRRYLKATGLPTYLSVPNLVEHPGGPSMTGNHGHGVRRAACHTGMCPPADSWRAPVVDGFVGVPFLNDGVAQSFVRTGGLGSRHWENLDVGAYVERLDGDIGDGAARLAELAGSGGGGCSRLVDAFGPARVRAVWLTSWAMGLATRAELAYRTVAGNPGADPEAVDRALATVAPGGLVTGVDTAVLDRLSAELAALVRLGVDEGAT